MALLLTVCAQAATVQLRCTLFRKMVPIMGVTVLKLELRGKGGHLATIVPPKMPSGLQMDAEAPELETMNFAPYEIASFKYHITPLASGKFIIPPFLVKLDSGRTLKTSRLSLQAI